MKRQSYNVFCAILIVLTACGTQTPIPPTRTPTAMPLPTATFTPMPTWTPTLTPTPTPIPPLIVNVTWPEEVSALEPPFVVADVMLPQGVTADIALSAKIYDPKSTVFTSFDLARQRNNRYVSVAPLELPLDALAGHWWLVVHVETALEVVGERMLPFKPAPIEFRALTETLPSGVNLRVPQAFAEVTAEGDPYAGGRVWQYGKGEIALWWAPGPTEPLLLNNAVVMLEATHDPDAPPEAQLVEETKWQERPAFLFHEEWPGRQGGPAEAWVIQGANYWLYVLRIRAVGVEPIPAVLHEIAATFTFDKK